MKTGEKVDGDVVFEIEDPRSQFEEKVVGEMQMEQFKAGLTERDKIILQMRAEKYTLQEIADKVGYQTPSAVKKRLEQITGSYENFIQEEYSTFLDEHTK